MSLRGSCYWSLTQDNQGRQTSTRRPRRTLRSLGGLSPFFAEPSPQMQKAWVKEPLTFHPPCLQVPTAFLTWEGL